MKNSKKGFTLAELIVVLFILSVVILIIVPVTYGSLTNSKNSADIANLNALNSAVRMQKILDQLNQPPVYSMVQQALDNATITKIPAVLHDSNKAFIWNNTIKKFEIGFFPGDPLTSLVYGDEDTVPPPPDDDIWIATKHYEANDYVYHNGILYYAKIANINNEPGQTTTWQEVTNRWRWFNSYYKDDMVIHGNHTYKAKYDNINSEPHPGSHGAWQRIIPKP